MAIFNIILRPLFIRYYTYVIKLLGGKLGLGANISNRLYYRVPKGAHVEIGDNFTFTSGGCYNTLARNIRGCIFIQNKDAELLIGDNVGISSSTFWIAKSVRIGNYVNIGADCMILDTDCHSLNWSQRGLRGGCDEQGQSIDQLNTKTAPVVIEDDVMLGARSIVLKGVTIGARTVIGAGSVVTQSIPPDCIAAGNPCKIIRKIENNGISYNNNPNI